MCQDDLREMKQQRPQSDQKVWTGPAELDRLNRTRSADGSSEQGMHLGRLANRLYGCLCLCAAY